MGLAVGAVAVRGRALVALTAFVLLEMHQRLPMLDLSLFRDRQFSGANTVMFMVGLAMFGIFFFNSLFLQRVLHYGAIKTGATFLPMTVLIIFVAPIAGQARRPCRCCAGSWAAAWSLLTGSLLLFARSMPGRRGGTSFPGLLVGGFGMAITMAPTTAAAMGSVPVDKAGVGSAVINSMRQVGGSLGIAIMGALVATTVSVAPFRSALRDAVRPGLPPGPPRRRGHPPRRRGRRGRDDPKGRARETRRNEQSTRSLSA